MIKLRRVYEPTQTDDGICFLVDRFWPRGVRRAALQMADWLKDVAPSADLCKWFGHDPERWGEFQERYTTELNGKPTSWQPILDAAQLGDVTLLYSTKDTQHNNAVVLRAFLESKWIIADKR